MSEESKISKAQQKAVNKYVKNNYDRINVTFPKGAKPIIQAHVSSTGESVNAFINRAVNETMERDNVTPPFTAAQNEPDQQSIPDQPAEHSTVASESARQKPRKPFTKEAADQINTEKLLNDFRYQLDIATAPDTKTISASNEYKSSYHTQYLKGSVYYATSITAAAGNNHSGTVRSPSRKQKGRSL